jgi:hypothetical protein
MREYRAIFKQAVVFGFDDPKQESIYYFAPGVDALFTDFSATNSKQGQIPFLQEHRYRVLN